MTKQELIDRLKLVANDHDFTYISGHWADIRDTAAAAVAALEG